MNISSFGVCTNVDTFSHCGKSDKKQRKGHALCSVVNALAATKEVQFD